MELNVGDYVRYESGLIGKVASKPYEYKDSISPDIDFGNGDIYNEYEISERIIKSSPNIIDILEAGDYVNGYLIKDKYIGGNLGLTHWVLETPTGYLTEKQIESIVTKEQFEAMQYVVGEE